MLSQVILFVGGLKLTYQYTPDEEKARLKESCYWTMSDSVSIFLSLVLAVTIIGLPKFFSLPTDPDKYLACVFLVLRDSLVDLIEFPFLVVLGVFPWRLYSHIKHHPTSLEHRVGFALKNLV